ncbi:BEN domain-containing protein 2-like [Cavia porcellus]|uniref:BEN domain-containing protein 2-like n=1 Tax=Cavia porcellus TaxID=10141 RepID=UPI002FDFF3FB
MSEEEDSDYIIVTIEDDYNDNTDDEDAVTEEDSANSDNSGDASMIQHCFEIHDENCQHLFSISDGFQDTEVQHDQLVSQMSSPTNLKRYMPQSTEQYCSSNKRGRTSPGQDNTSLPIQHNMERCVFENFYQEYHQNQLRAFQQCFQGLKELFQKMNTQISQLNEIFSAMEEFWEIPLMTQHGNGSPSLPVARPTTHAQASAPGTSLQSAASAQLQEPFVAVPLVVPPSGSPSVANNPDQMTYSDILRYKGMSPDSTLPSACILLHFGMPGTAEPTLENNPETKNYPPVIGNDDDQCPSSSSANSSSDSSSDKAVLLQMPEKAEAILKDYDGTMYCPDLLGSFTDLTPELSSATTSSDVGKFEIIHSTSSTF